MKCLSTKKEPSVFGAHSCRIALLTLSLVILSSGFAFADGDVGTSHAGAEAAPINSLNVHHGVQMFPPVGCSASVNVMTYDGTHNITCMAIPSCATGQLLTSHSNGQLVCETVSVCNGPPYLCSSFTQTLGRTPDAQDIQTWAGDYNIWIGQGLTQAQAQAQVANDVNLALANVRNQNIDQQKAAAYNYVADLHSQFYAQ